MSTAQHRLKIAIGSFTCVLIMFFSSQSNHLRTDVRISGLRSLQLCCAICHSVYSVSFSLSLSLYLCAIVHICRHDLAGRRRSTAASECRSRRQRRLSPAAASDTGFPPAAARPHQADTCTTQTCYAVHQTRGKQHDDTKLG